MAARAAPSVPSGRTFRRAFRRILEDLRRHRGRNATRGNLDRAAAPSRDPNPAPAAALRTWRHPCLAARQMERPREAHETVGAALVAVVQTGQQLVMDRLDLALLDGQK